MTYEMNDPELIESLTYLLVSREEKERANSRNYDGKKNCWILDQKDGFVSAEIQHSNGDVVNVRTFNGEIKDVRKSDIEQMNPPKYEKCEDMADLTYLNDASVLHNLRARYKSWLIYTYSGLFCVAINPYKHLPIYNEKIVVFYRGKKRNAVPPHLYYVADNAYASLLKERENQSLLITGESGAGKTENTKKVIQYFAFVAASTLKKGETLSVQQANLEDQIISTNPVMEAYGNAKTTRNNNSSRFGKFIRIHFSSSGKIAGADIESYLLEKSRVTYQQPLERNYHIFYQLLSSGNTDLLDELLLESDAKKYNFINQGVVTIDNIDDSCEMKLTNEAFDILSFTKEEKLNLYKATGAIIHFGNSKWKQRPREDQAETDGTEECEKASHLLGIESSSLLRGLLKPRIKVGNDYVAKSQNRDQVLNAIGALSRSIYSRCFKWLVDRVNETLDIKTKRQYFIGVLDIAGFEIFEYNGFEQLCINLTNEKLQQFFNHHMFVLEQEEYKKEGISWEMINFGLDLQACIDLIEKPMGIFSILEEECILPKASEKTFQEKLYSTHLGKHPSFGKPKAAKGGRADVHFELNHYAATVSYGISGWLEKNKDTINITVSMLFKGSKGNSLIAHLYNELGEDDDRKLSKGKGKGKGAIQTISSSHREQLNKLMSNLNQTSPHFVRCIIPNELKAAGVLDAHMVLQQLHCNGVLEGIRICSKGFPNRMIYAEFKQRYSILAPDAVPKGFCDAVTATTCILKKICIEEELFRLGTTKIFFRSGVLGQLEDLRDIAVSRVISMLQAQIRSYLTRYRYKKMLEQRLAMSILQRNFRKHLTTREWPWWKLYTKIKPLLSIARQDEEIKAREEEFKKLKEEFCKEETMRRDLEKQMVRLVKENNDIQEQLILEREHSNVIEECLQKMILQKSELETQFNECVEKLMEEENERCRLDLLRKRLEDELVEVKVELGNKIDEVKKFEAETRFLEEKLRELKVDCDEKSGILERLEKEKQRLEEMNLNIDEDLKVEAKRVENLQRVKAKLEQDLHESEKSCDRYRKQTDELEKIVKNVENEIKVLRENLREIDDERLSVKEAFKKKDFEFENVNAKLEDSYNLIAVQQKKLKESQNKVVELCEELESERISKNRAEKQRTELNHELDEIRGQLEEANDLNNLNAQHDLNKKQREGELAKLRKELVDAVAEHEATTMQMKRKYSEAIAELGEKIDQLKKNVVKLEKERNLARVDIDDIMVKLEQSDKAKLYAEKLNKNLEQQLNELNFKLEGFNRQIIDQSSSNQKLQHENSELIRQIEKRDVDLKESNTKINLLQSQLTETKSLEEEANRVKTALMLQIQIANKEFEYTRQELDEEKLITYDLQKQLVKTNSEVAHWRSKCEIEGLARAGELEEAKRKLNLKLGEAEEQVDIALSKCSSVEITKQRMQVEIEDLLNEVDRANLSVAGMEKKQKQFDKLIQEWRQKCEDVSMELDACQRDARLFSTELFKCKTQYEESLEVNEALRHENKNLVEEIKNLMDQLDESGRSVYETEKLCKKLEMEKGEMDSMMEEVELQLVEERRRGLETNVEIGLVRREADKRIQDKNEEIENLRCNHQLILVSLEETLGLEMKGKAEALQQKKKIEIELNELELAFEQLKKADIESSKSIKRLSLIIDELQKQVEQEQRLKDEEISERQNIERKFNLLYEEMSEVHMRLEMTEKARDSVEHELHEAANKIAELSAINSNLASTKKRLEAELVTINGDLEESLVEMKVYEERERKIAVDAARLAEELRIEQQHSEVTERGRKQLESQIKDLQTRLNETEANVIKGTKRTIVKLEQRIGELEQDLEIEHRRHQDALKEVRKNDRKLKEIITQSEEEKRNQNRMQELVDKLESKLRSYKRQLEEAESIAAGCVAKNRKLQLELGNVVERATEAEFKANKRIFVSSGQSSNQIYKIRAGSLAVDTPSKLIFSRSESVKKF